jgi:hypothetical protein
MILYTTLFRPFQKESKRKEGVMGRFRPPIKIMNYCV